ncbi:NAD(P)/FAD-dependent oxidoreductase [Roseitranquillus sediminis]|uniref:NAD(P)/FAD-dependent oxidoreductase n=1 Tax=Roseitranquillus sediminis TaxID=2809051 RepID=UPI001D0C89AD|nr:FAD-binding oxidoreductase [Roseitranquillus sediminis]MBM9594286.1 FAD-binding oxidoreductase [Roseitranquillus sediminis]
MNLLDANDRPGEHPRSWYAETAGDLRPRPPLAGDVRADVCVIGGGYTGLSTAWHLARTGARVVLLEAQRIGFGASGRNGGQVGSGQRLHHDALEARLGPNLARRLWDIAEDAKRLVRGVSEWPEVQAGWRPGVAAAARTEREAAAARAYGEWLAAGYDYNLVEPLDREEITNLTGSEVFAGGTIDWGAGHVHPLRLALGVARLADEAGAVLHEQSRVVRLDGTTAVTAQGCVRADALVLACNGYLGELSPAIAARVMPINNFVAATVPLGDRMPLARPVAVADDRFVVNYWRPTDDGRLLFGGGESYGYRFPAAIAAPVRHRLGAIYPQLRQVEITHAWGGTLAITRSRMPLFARPGRDIWSASGYSGHGVAMAMMAGRILAEAIRGETAGFDAMAAIPNPPFPGGTAARAPLLAAAMTWFALRDRFGI